MSDPEIDLAYIGRALQRLTAEVGSLRDDMFVMAAIVRRIDNNQDRMLDEIRAMQRQYDRLANRVGQITIGSATSNGNDSRRRLPSPCRRRSPGLSRREAAELLNGRLDISKYWSSCRALRRSHAAGKLRRKGLKSLNLRRKVVAPLRSGPQISGVPC
jgi:hypothetical protein